MSGLWIMAITYCSGTLWYGACVARVGNDLFREVELLFREGLLQRVGRDLMMDQDKGDPGS